jgi:hypothetical protein
MIWNEKKIIEKLEAVEAINRSLAAEEVDRGNHQFYRGRAEGIQLAIGMIERKI